MPLTRELMKRLELRAEKDGVTLAQAVRGIVKSALGGGKS